MIAKSQQLVMHIDQLKKGQIFSVQSLYELSSRSTIYQVLNSKIKAKEIVRIAKGFYVKPKTLSDFPNLEIIPGAQELAIFWASENGYKLVDQAFTESNRLGFSTQVPVKKLLWTDGPSRKFQVGNDTVLIQNKAESPPLLLSNQPEGRLYRALSITPASIITISAIKEAFKRMNTTTSQRIKAFKVLRESDLSVDYKEKLILAEADY